MNIRDRSMSMTADWGAGTMPPSGNTPKTMASQLSQRTRISRSEGCFLASHPSSSGCAQPTVPPMKLKTYCERRFRSSSDSSKRTRNHALSLGFGQKPLKSPLLALKVPNAFRAVSYYRARYYDPQAGRFLSEDPLGFGGNGTNFYAYAGNDPI